ncbi:MAG: hypothetical protein M1826_003162 [Phylliscum demangeonii]|nr:MAG: hypothetical protein M1826_003162 [Phylliscum demangeonii]
MKNWLACAAVLMQLSGRAWAHPHPWPGAEETNPDLPPATATANNNPKNAHVSKVGLVVGGVLISGGVAAGALLRQGQINQLQESNKQLLHHRERLARLLEPPEIQLRRDASGPWADWKVPAALLADAVMMECFYEYLNVQVADYRMLFPRDLRDAMTGCAHYHGRAIDRSWFADLDPDSVFEVGRPLKRATAWAESEGRGDEAAARASGGHAAGGGGGGEQHRAQFSVRPLAGTAPHWAKQLVTSAQRASAALAAGARRFPAYSSQLMQKEAPLWKKAAAGVAE